MEELGHDGSDADEVAGLDAPSWRLAMGPGSTVVSAPGRYISSGRGGEDEADTSVFQHLEVTVKVSRIGFEVFVGAELGRVDEDGDGNDVVL